MCTKRYIFPKENYKSRNFDIYNIRREFYRLWCSHMHGASWKDTVIFRSLGLRIVQLIVPVWHPTQSASPPGGIFPDALEGRPCWGGSAYWTQTSESVLPRASLVRPCFPGSAKRRLGLRELGKDCGPRVNPFLTTPTRSSIHDALPTNIYGSQKHQKEE